MNILHYIWNRLRKITQSVYLRNPITRYRIRYDQLKYLNGHDCSKYEKLVIFFAPGYDKVNGGIISISFLANETRRLYSSHKIGVFVCPIPGDPPLSKYTKFENEYTLVDYGLLLSHSRNVKKILLHIPECFVDRLVVKKKILFAESTGTQYSFNIMLQNIDFAPQQDSVEKLKAIGAVSITTAHKAYAGKATEKRYGCPVHHMSSWGSSREYEYKKVYEKRALIVVSPDGHPLRKVILRKIQRQLTDFQFITIQNMTNMDYRRLIADAKFSLTFGEGLDGYFAETIFSGGIGAAVYNDRFFDQAYQQLPFVYKSWDELSDCFADDVRRMNESPEVYNTVHKKQYELLRSHYSYEICLSNLVSFYNKYFPL